MKNHALWTLALAQLSLTGMASADDLPQLVQRRVRAMTAGLEGRDLPLLRRVPGPGREHARQRLVTTLEQTLGHSQVKAGDALSEEKADLTFVRSRSGRRWFLQVRSDGSSASFVDEDAMRRGRALAMPKQTRMTAAELERRARAFIGTTLREQVVVGPGEALEALATRHLIEDSVRAQGDQPVQDEAPRVLASRIVFGRQVEGVAVVGPGSWISVTFTNDGTPAEFEYDWPTYARVGQRRTTLAFQSILMRAGGLSRVPLDAPGVRLQHMECGYYDAASSGGAIQPACSLSYSHRLATGEVTAHSQIIPAATVVDEDPKWRETVELRSAALRPTARLVRPLALGNALRDAAARLRVNK